MTKQEIVLAIAIEEHARHVEEPPGRGWSRITDYIRDGLEWWRMRKSKRYTTNGSFLWCGAFAAFCYSMAGLKYSVRQKHLASCSRLYRWSGGSNPNERRIEPHAIEPGDIVVVGPEIAERSAPRRLRTQRPRWGRHICIAHRKTDDGWACIDGNAHGSLPGGTRAEGVVRTLRPYAAGNPRTYRILYGIRPLAADYD